MKKLFLLLLLACCSLSAFSQKKYSAIEHEDFMTRIETIQLGCDKETVIQIMGKPHKVGFAQYKDRGVVNLLSYKVSIFKEQWFIINYGFVFYNSRLIALVETEFMERDNSTASDQSSIGYIVTKVLPAILPDTEKNTCTCESNKEQQTAIPQ